MLLSSWQAKRVVAKRLEQEGIYDALQPGSPDFRNGHKANFSLSGADVLSAVVKGKPQGVKGWLSSGNILELNMASGKKRKFVLIEDQNIIFVKNQVSRVVGDTQLVD